MQKARKLRLGSKEDEETLIFHVSEWRKRIGNLLLEKTCISVLK